MLTLNCSQCGAPIELRGSALTVKCPYCGTTQALPPDLARQVKSGAWALCPLCGENDRLVRVSALVTQGGVGQNRELISRLTLKEPDYFDLTPPKLEHVEIPPLSNMGNSVVVGAAVFVLSVLLFWSFMGVEDVLVSYGCGTLSCLVGIVSLLALLNLPVALREEAARWQARKRQRQAYQEYRRQRERYQREFVSMRQANERMKHEYEERLKIWERLYYCFRDDCVCLPAEGLSAPLEKMAEFIEAQRASRRE